MSIITVENLTKTYRGGKVKAVDGATFQIEQGEAFGLIGPNGAGKTTIFSCLLALTHPSSGRIAIEGKSPFNLDVKSLIGVLPERPSYNRWMSIKQFLSFHHWLAGFPAAERDAEIKRLLDLVELEVDVNKTKIRELSRGMLQRIGIAQALIGRPKIIFLDEPTSGMDPLGFILIRKLLLKCKEDGMTVVLNSHHLNEVEKVCDRIAFIRKGKIEQVTSVSELSEIRKTLVISWLESKDESRTESQSGNADTIEKLKAVCHKCDCSIIDTDGNTARLAVSDKEHAADVIEALMVAGVRVYQSNFEKRELVELFLQGQGQGEDQNDAQADKGVK